MAYNLENIFIYAQPGATTQTSLQELLDNDRGDLIASWFINQCATDVGLVDGGVLDTEHVLRMVHVIKKNQMFLSEFTYHENKDLEAEAS